MTADDRSAVGPARPRIGLVSGGLGAYWDQFPRLREQLKTTATKISSRLASLPSEVIDAGFISDVDDGRAAARRLREGDCDLVIINLSTYLTSSMIMPIIRKLDVPHLVLSLQPDSRMPHAEVDTKDWLAYCSQCAVPELGNVFRRSNVPFRSVTGWLGQDAAWERIEHWVRAASVRSVLRNANLGLMGHLYPGMLDVSTDMTRISSDLGSHVEVLEIDDLRVRVERVTDAQVGDRINQVRDLFELKDSASRDDVRWAAKVSVGLDQLVEDFDLDVLAYYHRGLDGEVHERVAAGMILGSSLLTARGVPSSGEFELRTAIAQLITQTLDSGGSFTEIQALNFDDGVVEMGHDGPADLSMSSGPPVLRGLGTFHGKRGFGVSVELNIQDGPVTLVGLGQDADGSLSMVAAQGTAVPGPRMSIGNTTTRIDFGQDPGKWVDAWSSTGVGHHWSISHGHTLPQLRCVADLLGIDLVEVPEQS